MEIRKHLSLQDLKFITRTLGGDSYSERNALLQLLLDPDTVDSILDHEILLDTALKGVNSINLSSRLYFYLHSRTALKSSGLDSPELADYISGILNSHLKMDFHPHNIGNVLYIVEWLKQIERNPAGKRFELHVMAGNRLLFLTGIFPKLINRRSESRGAPSIEFYESVAKQSFRSAAESPINPRSNTNLLYNEIADTFSGLRYALNDMSERLGTIN